MGTTRDAVLDSARMLVDLLSDEHESPERILKGYLEARGLLSDWMYQLAVEQVKPAVGRLEEVKALVKKRMEYLFADRIPAQYLRVRGYRSTHAHIYALLFLNQGEPVTADRIRILTADAVHTERRIRELRALGLTIDAVQLGALDAYVLRSKEPDVNAAAKEQVKHNLKSKSVQEEERKKLLAKI
jgi:hypothetical protein